jgi:hypothetical protein
MCEAQKFLLQQSAVPVHVSLKQWLLDERTGWVCISNIRDLQLALANSHKAAQSKR